jgi:hypothetical protein
VFAKQMLYHLSNTSSPLAVFILELGSCELFAWAGLEPQSSRSQPPKYLESQV